MCQFIGWIEVNDEVLFLTADDLATKRGRELKRHLGAAYAGDVIGHGAIRWFYDMPNDKGENRECDDFSTPANFPPEIAEAMKAGKFRGMAVVPGALAGAALDEYEKIRQPAWDEYAKVRQAAWAEYNKVIQAAGAEYAKIRQAAFWDIWAEPENRIEAWR